VPSCLLTGKSLLHQVMFLADETHPLAKRIFLARRQLVSKKEKEAAAECGCVHGWQTAFR
jgi:hypothetical protein